MCTTSSPTLLRILDRSVGMVSRVKRGLQIQYCRTEMISSNLSVPGDSCVRYDKLTIAAL